MSVSSLNEHIVGTLLYYEIFEHPLTAHELFSLLPQNSITLSALQHELDALSKKGVLQHLHGFYTIPGNGVGAAALRLKRQELARKRIQMARFMTHIIKRFPFVRAIFLSGDLSKGVADPKSDIDYVIVTAPHRLWICRTLLILFKKVFLLNSRKYFCLNYYVDSDHLVLTEQSYYTATEIAHLKPLYNITLYLRYMNANAWIKEYFPNYRIFAMHAREGNNRTSYLQRTLELPFAGAWANRLDRYLMNSMERIWRKRYPEYDEATRENIFRCSEHESRAFIGNFAGTILALHQEKLRQHNLATYSFR